MGLINFFLDIIRKLMIAGLSVVVLFLLSIYVIFYPSLSDPNDIMLWITVIPLCGINLLIKKKK